jgi:hypothetical protein
MTGPVRVRRHTDGRTAVAVPQTEQWCVVDRRHTRGAVWSDDAGVTGPGWSELLVAELPPPDQIGEASTKRWITFGDPGSRMTVYANGIQFQTPGGGEATYGPNKVEALRDANAVSPALDVVCYCGDGTEHEYGTAPLCSKVADR